MSPNNLHLQSLKKTEKAENDNSYIIRVAELHGKRGKGDFKMFKSIHYGL